MSDVAHRHFLDIAAGVVDGAGEDDGAIRIEPGAEPKIGRRDGPQPVERFLRPAIAARSRWALRQAVVQHQGQVLFQPVQADGPEWNVHVVIRAIDDQPGRRFGEPHQGPQQPQLVGGRFVVVHDHVAQQRQAAGAIVRHGEDERFPLEAGASQVGPGGAAAQRDGAAVGIADQFFRRGVVEPAGGIFGGIPAAAQGDHQQAGWTEQFGKDAERPLPALRRYVHPYGTQQDQIEPAPERAQGSQIRQRVVHPDNALVRITGGLIAQGARFHRHHLPVPGRQPIGVPTGACADIAGETGFGGQVCRCPGGVDFGGVQGVVLGEEGVAVSVVVRGGVHGGQNAARYWEAASRT